MIADRIRAALLGAVLLLAACVSAPPRPVVPLDPQARRALLQSLDAFSLSGRLAAAVGQDGFSANIDWTQRDARSVLDLRAPLGFGSAHVERDGTHMNLETSRGEKLSGPDAAEGLAARLGFEPPMDRLRFWALGVADPSAPAVEAVDAQGLPASIEQEGWRIEFSEYRTAPASSADAQVPRRLTLTRGPVRLRLVVDRWTLGSK
ncbi:MAG: outer rane lipoprotein LolB [Pseudomonadota bacterium]